MRSRFIQRAVIATVDLEWPETIDRLLEVFMPKDPNLWGVVLPLKLGLQAYKSVYWAFFPYADFEEPYMQTLEEHFVHDENLEDWDAQFSEVYFYSDKHTNPGKYPPMILYDRTGDFLAGNLSDSED